MNTYLLNKPIKKIKILGNSYQNGTPTPTSPILIQSFNKSGRTGTQGSAVVTSGTYTIINGCNDFLNDTIAGETVYFELKVPSSIVPASGFYCYFGYPGVPLVSLSSYSTWNNEGTTSGVTTFTGSFIMPTREKNLNYLYLWGHQSVSSGTTTVNSLKMWTKSDTVKLVGDNKELQIPNSITLNNQTISLELNKLDTYVDKIIIDKIDGRVMLTKAVKYAVLDKDINIGDYNYPNSNNKGFGTYAQGSSNLMLDGSYSRQVSLCDYSKSGDYYDNTSYLWAGVGNAYLYYVGYYTAVGVSSAADFKSWLGNRHINTIYGSYNSIITDITDGTYIINGITHNVSEWLSFSDTNLTIQTDGLANSDLIIDREFVPDEFQWVEYIQSSGTQYIDTGYKGKTNDIVEIKMMALESGVDKLFYGSYETNSVYSIGQYGNYYRFNVQPVSDLTISLDVNTIKTFTKKSDGYWYYNGAHYGSSVANNSTKNAFLFGRNYGDFGMSKMRLYSCTIYDSTGVPIRNFIPCYRKSDNEIGLYDTVNDIFYTNAGTGTFTKGSDATLYDKKKVSAYLLKRIVPAEYQPVEYLQIHDSTQGILLSYTWSQISKIELGYMQLVDVTLSTRGAIILASHANNSFTSTSPWVAANGKKDGSVAISPTGGALNTLYDFTVTNSSTSTNSIKIGGWSDDAWTMQGNYYYVRIYDTNQQLLCNLLPVKRITDNKPGLYDTINDVFYTNANTSATQDFTVGSNIDPFIKQKVAVKLLCSDVPKEYQQVEYLQSGGSQWIDTGISSTSGFTSTITLSLQQNATEILIGTQASSAASMLFINSGYIKLGVSSNQPAAKTFTLDTKYQIEFSTENSYYIKIDGVQYLSGTDSNNRTNRNITIFGGVNNAGSMVYTANMKLYGNCTISIGTTLIRNFIPCYRKADNKPGLYDTVNGVFYTNANTSATQDFTVGSNKWLIK